MGNTQDTGKDLDGSGKPSSGASRPKKGNNRYAGTCYKCGKHVPAMTGIRVLGRSNDATAWKVQHKECAGKPKLVRPLIQSPEAQ